MGSEMCIRDRCEVGGRVGFLQGFASLDDSFEDLFLILDRVLSVISRLWFGKFSPVLHTSRDRERIRFAEVTTEQSLDILDVGVGSADGSLPGSLTR